MRKEFTHNGFSFSEGTPLVLCDMLISLNKSRERIVIDYGDTSTGQSWNEEFETTGYVGKSTGINPVPLLVYNSRALGGGAIMTSSILSIKSSKGKRLLYQHEKQS